MEKDQITIIEDRGVISVSGSDANDFLQNIVSNDINKVNYANTKYAAIFTPQGKYLYEFFIIKTNDGYFLDCSEEFVKEIIAYLSKYKLRSDVKIKDYSSFYAVGIINLERFKEIQKKEGNSNETFLFRESFLFIDPRNHLLGARILSNLEKLYLTIKKLNLRVINSKNYLDKAHSLGVPIYETKNLKEQLFGLEANFEELGAIDFKKGCYVGQENTARIKLKNKLTKRLLPIEIIEGKLIEDEKINNNNVEIGKILINEEYPFALVKYLDKNFDKNQTFKTKNASFKINIPEWLKL